jgi:hypothetical protein
MVELSRSEKVVADKTVCIVLVQGNGMNDEPIWAYVAVRLSDMEKFMNAQKLGNFDPEEFGVIVEAGAGAQPPAKITEKMETEYGFNHEKMLHLNTDPNQ